MVVDSVGFVSQLPIYVAPSPQTTTAATTVNALALLYFQPLLSLKEPALDHNF